MRGQLGLGRSWHNNWHNDVPHTVPTSAEPGEHDLDWSPVPSEHRRGKGSRHGQP
ncbi:hypothetical protein [Kibdelosporangium philippinense]|uniref:hypothetical protein n=1 Tax=Kibdelosporangium philippinense TaxID=211113 RepID=UPI0036102A7C